MSVRNLRVRIPMTDALHIIKHGFNKTIIVILNSKKLIASVINSYQQPITSLYQIKRSRSNLILNHRNSHLV